MFNNKKERIYFTIFLFGYLFFLIWIILLKLTININYPNYIVSRGINLIPFNNFRKGLSLLAITKIWLTRGLMALLYLPAGLFTSVIIKKSFILRLFISSSISLVFEILQWIFSIGISDITDYLLALIGSFLGIVLFILIEKYSKKYTMNIINGFGITILSLGEIYLSVIMLLNYSKLLGSVILFFSILLVIFYVASTYLKKSKESL